MPPFPSSFPPKRESITTFDFTDIASGLGFEKYWLTGSEDSVGIKHFISSLNLTSSPSAVASSANNSTTTVNFDTSVFNLPRTVKGTVYYQIIAGSGSSSNTDTVSGQIAIVHADLSVTTISSEVVSEDIDGTFPTTYLIEIPLTQTTIKKGEKLRLITKITEDGGTTLNLGHTGSSSFLLIPFRIDLT